MQSLRIAALAALLSLPILLCAAQAGPPSAGPQASAPTSAETHALIERYMVPVAVELTAKLNSRNAAVGQLIAAKTSDTAKLADGTTLPRGTKLVGHVTQVQALSADQPYARLAVTFDRAELKNGQTVALRSEVRMVAPPAEATLSSPDNMMADAQAGAGASASGTGPSGARGGAGLGANLPSAGPMHPVGQTASSTLGDDTPGGRSLAEAAAGTGGVVAQAGETVNPAPRATGLPGVMLSTSTAADPSGTLMAAGRNISLESGTRITLGLITR